jgi:hypothetical protein
MTISEYELFDVSTSPTKRPCEYCGDRPATVDARWCSKSHRRNALRDSARADPSPDEIRRLCAEIRSAWPPDRWRQFTATVAWEPPLIDGSEIDEG